MNDNKFEVFMENEYNKLITEYKSTSLLQSSLKNDYVYACYTENTNDMHYYMEEEEKVEKKKVGIIKKILEWFKKFFKAIKDKILKLIGMKPKKYEVWEKVPEINKGLKGLVNTLKTKFKNIKNSYGFKFVVDYVKTLAIMALVINIPRMTKGIVKTVSEVQGKGLLDGIKSSMEQLEAYIHEMDLDEYKGYKDNKENEPFTLLNLLKSIVNGILLLLSTAFRPIGDIVDAVVDNSIYKEPTYVYIYKYKDDEKNDW